MEDWKNRAEKKRKKEKRKEEDEEANKPKIGRAHV